MSRRRREARTDETTLSEGIRRNVELEGIMSFAESTGLTISKMVMAEKEGNEKIDSSFPFVKSNIGDATTPMEILKRTLSVRSVLSTTSSFAERMEALRTVDPQEMRLTQIGKGSFGTVYEIPGTEWCLKKTLSTPAKLWDEFANGKIMNSGVNDKARKAILKSEQLQDALMPRVPTYLCSYGMDQSEAPARWFRNNGHMFPVEDGGQKPGPVICLERIMPLPKVIRENLILYYFSPEKQEQALEDDRNKACICRAYLGCLSTDIPADKLAEQRETLQNFPLYLDQQQELEMDPFSIARDMAVGLAAGHWAAHLDMLDVEYVIGSRPYSRQLESQPISDADCKARRERSHQRVRNMGTDQSTEPEKLSFRNRAIQLWMIDFNKAESFNYSADDDYHKNIEQLVANTRSTDEPYYPRVLARSEFEWKLWLEFARTYIQASRIIETDKLNFMEEEAGKSRLSDLRNMMLKRPALVINEWMKAEATEYGWSSKEFRKNLKDNNWEMP